MSARRNDEGAVLLTTLLIVSLMASLAVAILEVTRVGARRAIVTDASAQARHYLDGAETYALGYLSEQLATAETSALNLLMLDWQDVTFPIDGGTITLSLSDGTNCFSPSDALGGGAERLLRLFVYRGVPEFEAVPLVARLKDWQDEDQSLTPGGAEDGSYLGLSKPYRTAGSPMTSVTELRAVQGLTPEIFEAVAPYMCTRAADGPINVNTLRPEDAPILAAQQGTDLGDALGLIASRPAMGWSDLTAFGIETPDKGGADEPELDPDVDTGMEPPIFPTQLDPTDPANPDTPPAEPELVTEPQILDVALRVDFGGLTRYRRVQVDVTGAPSVLTRQSGEAAIPLPRPRPDTLGTDDGTGFSR